MARLVEATRAGAGRRGARAVRRVRALRRRAVLLRRLRARARRAARATTGCCSPNDAARLRRGALPRPENRGDEAALRARARIAARDSAARWPKRRSRPRAKPAARASCSTRCRRCARRRRSTESLGFREIAPYLREPTPGALCFELRLYLGSARPGAVVERSCSNGIDTTCPPRASTPPRADDALHRPVAALDQHLAAGTPRSAPRACRRRTR